MAVDVIGIFYTPVVTDTEGEYVSGGNPLPGYHVNMIPAIPEWEKYRVEPMSKHRVFSGMDAETVCYIFPDEATFLTACAAAGITPA